MWRHICAFAKSENIKPCSWVLWLADDGVKEDLFSFCVRGNSPGAFAALVDLAFIFHWEFMCETDRASVSSSFALALTGIDPPPLMEIDP